MKKQTYQSVYFAFLDILGFNAIVSNNSHEKLEQLYLRMLSNNVDRALSGGRIIEIDNGQDYVFDTRYSCVNSLLVSDSIMMWTNDDSNKAFIDVVQAVRHMMAASIYCGMPLRGAISLGPITLFVTQSNTPKLNYQHTLFGKAIVDAVSAEKVQQWSGCLIAETAIDRFKSHLASQPFTSTKAITLERAIEKKYLLRYLVPKKQKDQTIIEEEEFVVDWVNVFTGPIKASTVTNAFSKHGKSVATSSIKDKINNTIKFVRHVNPAADKDIVRKTVPVL